jgi:hypothetical protein
VACRKKLVVDWVPACDLADIVFFAASRVLLLVL